MSRIGLTLEQLLVATWSSPRRRGYAARVPGLNVLQGETIALVGDGRADMLDLLIDALASCTVVDGGAAAAAGTLRIHAQQAARVGVQALAITEPFDNISDDARALAVADLAGLSSLGVTSVVAVTDAELAASFADRVVVVRGGQVVVAYPVVAAVPRARTDIEPVSQRLAAHLSAVS